MNDSVFLDTNALVYAYSNDDPTKRQVALQLGTAPDRWLSTQVLIEFANVLSRKLKTPWPDVQIALLELASNNSIHQTTPATIAHAARRAQRYGLAWFDALTVAAALACGCDRLYAKDLPAGQLFDGQLTVANPFATQQP